MEPKQEQEKKEEEQSLIVETVDSGSEFHIELASQFHQLCALEFNESELEKLSTWIHLLKTQQQEEQEHQAQGKKEEEEEKEKEKAERTNSACYYKLSFTVVLRKGGDGKILGGTQQEFYPASRCGLLPYVVVSEKARGMGLSKKLVESGFSYLQKLALKLLNNNNNSMHEMFIEVSQKSDAREDGTAYHTYEAAVTRHKIWEKIGFVGLDFSFYHPGYLKNSLHQIACFRPDKSRRPVSAKTVVQFIRDEFRGIMIQQEGEGEDEEKFDLEKEFAQIDSDLEKYARGREMIECCDWL